MALDADGCGEEGSLVVVSVTAALKKALTEDTLVLYNSLIKRLFRVVCIFLIS